MKRAESSAEQLEAIQADFVMAVAKATRRAIAQRRGLIPVPALTDPRRKALKRARELARQ